jgi:hypothetical protein
VLLESGEPVADITICDSGRFTLREQQLFGANHRIAGLVLSGVLAGSICLATLASPQSESRAVAITIDDLPGAVPGTGSQDAA